LLPIEWVRASAELNHAGLASRLLLLKIVHIVSKTLTAMVKSLREGIPDYKPYTSDTFDADKVRAELIGKDCFLRGRYPGV
jgi:hypothetical protein